MSKIAKLNKLSPLYMATRNFEVVDENGNVVVVENYDIIILVKSKVYINSIKYYMYKAKESASTCFILRPGDVALNYLMKIEFVASC